MQTAQVTRFDTSIHPIVSTGSHSSASPADACGTPRRPASADVWVPESSAASQSGVGAASISRTGSDASSVTSPMRCPFAASTTSPSGTAVAPSQGHPLVHVEAPDARPATPASNGSQGGWGAGFASWLGAHLGFGSARPPRSYAGRWALVTGASSGIGASFAEELARRGANVMLTARSADKLQALATRLCADHGVKAEVFPADLSLPNAASHLLASIRKRGLRVDVLVNNAGLGAYGRAENIDPESRRTMLQLNMAAPTALALGCLPDMQAAKDGTMINVASIAAFFPLPWMTTYSATKAYMLHFSEGLWAENRDSNVRVLAVCPGPIDTPFFDQAGMVKQPAVLGKRSTCQSVVDAAFKAVEEDRSYVLCNTPDYLKAQAMRLAPRSWAVSTLEQLMRPSRAA